MNKKIVALVSIALLLVAFAAMACAETELTIYAPNGRGVGRAANTAVSKSLDSVDKAVVDLYPSRGATVNMYYWYDGSGRYNMKTGNQVESIYYDIRGDRFYVKVTQGSSWLGVRAGSDFGSFEWVIKDNNSTALRTGRIEVRDSYGLIYTLVVKQSCKVDIVSVRQLAGSYDPAFNTASVRFQVTASSGNPGKILYSWNEAKQDYIPVKYTKAGKIFFHNNRPVNGIPLYYYVCSYRNMGGSTHVGPVDPYGLWTITMEAQ